MDPQIRKTFATTQWSLVLEAVDNKSPEANQALEVLCQSYWYPLYAFARKRGHNQDDAADLTQEFFSRMIDRSLLQAADPARGRFRSFLLTIFQRFLARQYHETRTEKQGGKWNRIEFDSESSESRYIQSPAAEQSAEHLFEREWALTLLSQVLEQLQAEYSSKGKADFFNSCRPFLIGTSSGDYALVAGQLNMSEGALRVAIHRMRDRYRELLRQTVAATVSSPQEIDEELAELRRALRGKS
jgi:RNA polymerase sigma factor (sigma-70 family)